MSNRNKWKWAEIEDSKKKKKCFRWVFDNLRPNTYKNVEGDFPMSHS